jgi:transcriptional regulator with XRE-family HTH domain
MAFPDNLRRVRLGQFLSQAELARRSGVHALTITRLEAGRTAPSTRTGRALAQALGIGRLSWQRPRKSPKPTGATSEPGSATLATELSGSGRRVPVEPVGVGQDL